MHDLCNAEFWQSADRKPHIKDLQRRAELHPGSSDNGVKLWHAVNYDVAVQILSDSKVFSSTSGSLLEDGYTVPSAGSAAMMALADGDQHRRLRNPAKGHFSRSAVAKLRGSVQRYAREVVSTLLGEGTLDVTTSIGLLPANVMCDLFNIQEQDRHEVRLLTDQAFLGKDHLSRASAHRAVLGYFYDATFSGPSRSETGTQSVGASYLAALDSQQLSPEEVILNLDNIFVGGVQTVRHTAVMSLSYLLATCHSWQEVEAIVQEHGLEAFIDELLRITTVSLHTLRTVQENTEVGGQTLTAGDRVAVWLWAANHDEVAFPNPDRLVPGRTGPPHLAFGRSRHYCLGAWLARTELELLFSELCSRVSTVQGAGMPVWNDSIINQGYDSYFLTFTGKESA